MHSFVTSKNVKLPRFLAHPVYAQSPSNHALYHTKIYKYNILHEPFCPAPPIA